LLHLSRAGTTGKRDPDEDPRWRRRGRRRRGCSDDERWPRSCAREPMSPVERVRAINWMKTCWIEGDRRRPMRRRRGRTPASIGKALWCTREPMDGSNSFRVMMWCWPESRGGVGVPGASYPRWRPKAAAAALVGDKLQWKLGKNSGSSSTSKQRGS
jgi:hypothetical protein